MTTVDVDRFPIPAEWESDLELRPCRIFYDRSAVHFARKCSTSAKPATGAPCTAGTDERALFCAHHSCVSSSPACGPVLPLCGALRARAADFRLRRLTRNSAASRSARLTPASPSLPLPSRSLAIPQCSFARQPVRIAPRRAKWRGHPPATGQKCSTVNRLPARTGYGSVRPLSSVPGTTAMLRQSCSGSAVRCVVRRHIPISCRSSVVEHSLGKGEVESSIPSGSTIPLKCL